MPEHNIKTVPIYFQNEKIGTAEIDFLTNIVDETGNSYNKAWSVDKISIFEKHKSLLIDHIHGNLHHIVDMKNGEGIALSIGYPEKDFKQFSIYIFPWGDSEISYE